MKFKDFKILLNDIQNQKFFGHVLTINGPNRDEEGYRLKDEQIILLVQILKNKNITELNLQDHCIGDIGAIALASLTNLQKLNVMGNQITAEGATALAKSNLKILNLSENYIIYNKDHDNQYQTMIQSFVDNNTIITLDLRSSVIPSEMISNLIKNNITIKTLWLGSGLTDDALKFLGTNTCLTDLLIGSNNITDFGAKYILENTSLKKLHIAYSNIGDRGAAILSIHPVIQKLTIVDSNITPQGAQFFLDSNIKKVGLFHWSKQDIMSFEERDQFEKAFEQSKIVQQLKAQQEYYDILIKEYNIQDVFPDMQNINSIQNAIDYIQDQLAQEYLERELMGND